MSVFGRNIVVLIFGGPGGNSSNHATRLNKLKEILKLDQLNSAEQEQMYKLLEKNADRF